MKQTQKKQKQDPGTEGVSKEGAAAADHEKKRPRAAYAYILRCRDGSLYTGWTNDLQKRLASHQSGRGAKYTKARRPVELVYSERFATKEEAMRREWQIKQLTKAQKEELVRSGERSG